ncbi:MAG: cysteine desulfurase [Planctomycetales bacterium]
MNVIYLDHNATAPLWPEVADALDEATRAGYANPASQHAPGRRARQALEDAREEIGARFGAETQTARRDQVILTSGGTEANNLALFGLTGHGPRRAILSAIEHPSVSETADALAQDGWQVDRIRVSPDGIVDVEHLRELLAEPVAVVSVMAANNETGVLQPLAEIAAACASAGVPLHADAVQAGGKVPLDFRQLGLAAMTVSAHKMHGPRGIGALIARHGIQLRPRLHGGFQQGGLRPGTEAVAPAVGMLAALRLWDARRETIVPRMTQLRDRFEDGLRSALVRLDGLPAGNQPNQQGGEVVINGAGAPRLPHATNAAFPGLDRQALMMALDFAGIACSTGSACASGSSEPSPTLIAMGCPPDIVKSSLRFSLGAGTTAEEIDEALRRIQAVVSQLRGQADQRS